MLYELRSRDLLLGVLSNCSPDQPWFFCGFEATPAFDAVRPLFERELRVLQNPGGEFDVAAWEEAYAEIDWLGLRLVSIGGEEEIADFVLHVQDRKAWFRY